MATNQKMQNTIRPWWIYLLNGLILTVLGFWMLKMPKESFNWMVLIVGLIITFTGLLESFLAIYYRKALIDWGWSLAGGLVDFIIGLFLIANPQALLLIISFFISFWLVVRGISTIRDALQWQKGGGNRWKWMLSFGILLLLMAVILVWHPQIVGLTLMFWLSISIITLGILRIVLAFKLLSQPGSS